MADTSIDSIFIKFDKDHPEIAEMFSQFVKELRDAAIVRIRPEEIIYRIRWQLITVSYNYGVADQIKRQFGNRYAIKMINENAKYESFFDLTVAEDWGKIDGPNNV